MNISLTAVVPVYNEREGVASSLSALSEALDAHLPGAQIIVVDDGSTDGTGEILASVNNIAVLRNEHNLGYGASVKRGIRKADSDWVLITDGDDSYPASNLTKLLEPMSDDGMNDMVIGRRPLSTISNPAIWNRSKVIFQALLAVAIGHRIPDINSGMRIFRRDLALGLEPILANGFSFSSGLTVSFLRSGFRVVFTEIDYVERKGQSKVRPLSFTAAFLRSVTRAYIGAPRIARQLRPTK